MIYNRRWRAIIRFRHLIYAARVLRVCRTQIILIRNKEDRLRGKSARLYTPIIAAGRLNGGFMLMRAPKFSIYCGREILYMILEIVYMELYNVKIFNLKKNCNIMCFLKRQALKAVQAAILIHYPRMKESSKEVHR